MSAIQNQRMTMTPAPFTRSSHLFRWACLSALALPCLLQAQGNYRTVVLPRERALMPSGEYAVDSYGSAVQKSPADTLRITGQTDKAGQHTVQSELNGKPQSGGTYATGAQRACVQYGTPQMPGNAQPLSDCKTVQTKDSQRTSCNGGNFVMSIRALSQTEWEIESLIKPQFLQGGRTGATLPDEIHTREHYTLVSNTCSK